ncbi:MAG TPA: HDIG domain-containing protein, partial [Candidatus Dormibacteraeota bacterium]|nr:HDIG domain-containing protein [Candidatus Dormibacteraeota bacterium]
FTRRDAGRFTVAAALLVVALAAILSIDILPTQVDLGVGQVATTDVRAPRAAEYVSAIQTAAARQAARDKVEPQYDYTADKGATLAAQQARAFEQRVAPVDAAFDASLKPAERTAVLQSAVDGLSDKARATLVALDAKRWTAVRTEAARVLDMLVRSELRDTQVAVVRASLVDRIGGDLSDAERGLASELISPLVVPNSAYSDSQTQAERDRAATAVPPVTVSVSQGEIVVRNGERVTALQYEEIQQLGLDQPRPDMARLAGWVVLAFLVVVTLLGWLWRFRPTLWHRNNVLLLVGLVLLFTAFALKITAGRQTLPYFLPTAASAMLVAVLLDAWAATVLLALVALLGGAVNGDSLQVATYIFLGGFAGILTIRRGDRLQVFVQAGLAVAAANVLVVTTFQLLGERSDLTGLLQLWGACVISAGGAAVATVGSFAVLGNLFGIVTVFQLLELANPTQPLLRRLLVETPGTYHHSLMVGNLAERAAESIGADPLIARVAAFYHDVGKLANPLAFIENQAGTENIHDQLEPEVSATILKQHVADGIDLAYRYRLPKTLIAFIPQHHGTARMSFFYAKARELAAAPYGGEETVEGAAAADAVDERRFRHAGPKPQSKEAAILMLADGVEASVRSLTARDEAAIRAMVSRIIEERVSDGQFDECDLPLRDIERIRESFVAQLLGMYHQRIAYPQNKIVELESRRAAGGGGA